MSEDGAPFPADVLHVEAKHDRIGTTTLVGEFDMTGTERFWPFVNEALAADPRAILVDASGPGIHRLVGAVGLAACSGRSGRGGRGVRYPPAIGCASADHRAWRPRGAAGTRVTNSWFSGLADGQYPRTQENGEAMASELLHVETTATGTETVMAIAGEFDVSSTESFGADVGAALDHHPGSITIDARGVTFIDSSGLRSLLLARGAAVAAGVPFRLSEPSPVLLNRVERTGLRHLLLDD